MSAVTLTQLFDDAQGLHQAGRLAEAKALYQQVLAADPRHAGSLHMLGVMAYQMGQSDVAVNLLKQAAARDPSAPSLHSNLGLALRALGRDDEALAAFRRALRLAPERAEVHVNLGNALLDQAEAEAAMTSYQAALALNPSLTEARAGLGDALDSLAAQALERSDADISLARIVQSLAVAETVKARRLFVEIAQRLRWSRDDPEIRALMTRAITEGWGRPSALAAAAASLVVARGGELAEDDLLHALLCATPNCDVALETSLTTMRRDVLARATEGDHDTDGDSDLAFASALAQQCFLNDYVFCLEDGEATRAGDLRARLKAMLDSGFLVPPLWVIAVACYFPLSSLAGAARLQQNRWPEAVMALLTQQLDEPTEEQHRAAALPRLTPIAGGEHEDHLYPRWVRGAAAAAPIALGSYLATRFPRSTQPSLTDAPDILIAGCGTGLYALELARSYRAKSILAVDLSRASLAYAARKAEESGVSIAFAQADIREATQLDRDFNVIECSGVLHNLADPFAGWGALLTRLRSGGVMRVGIFSKIGRAPVDRARAWVAQQGFAATPDGLRQCRRRLMDEGAGGPFGDLLGATHFFSHGAARDLLFNTAQRPVTLDEIATFLGDNGLAFLGFEIGPETLAAYRTRFPSDPAATDLSHWRDFEAENPATFASMFEFWVRKP